MTSSGPVARTFAAESIVELGIWDGGSTALWFEVFQPQKLVAMDLMTRGDSEYFREFVRSRNIESRISTHWGVDQSDAAQVATIITKELSGPLDLVIDDASHMYEETKASFELLFPLVRPGGLYIIEDWAWSYFREFQEPSHPWLLKPELSKLVMQMLEANGSTQSFASRVREGPHGAETVRESLLTNITVFPHFVAIERGDIEPEKLNDFNIESFISRQASVPVRTFRRSKQIFRRRAARLLRQIHARQGLSARRRPLGPLLRNAGWLDSSRSSFRRVIGCAATAQSGNDERLGPRRAPPWNPAAFRAWRPIPPTGR